MESSQKQMTQPTAMATVEELQNLYSSALALREYANDVASAAERILGAQLLPTKQKKRRKIDEGVAALKVQILAGTRKKRKK